jgi:hypothetical protein
MYSRQVLGQNMLIRMHAEMHRETTNSWGKGLQRAKQRQRKSKEQESRPHLDSVELLVADFGLRPRRASRLHGCLRRNTLRLQLLSALLRRLCVFATYRILASIKEHTINLQRCRLGHLCRPCTFDPPSLDDWLDAARKSVRSAWLKIGFILRHTCLSKWNQMTSA